MNRKGMFLAMEMKVAVTNTPVILKKKILPVRRCLRAPFLFSMLSKPQAKARKPLMMCRMSIIFNRLFILLRFKVPTKRLFVYCKNACFSVRFPNARGEWEGFGTNCKPRGLQLMFQKIRKPAIVVARNGD